MKQDNNYKFRVSISKDSYNSKEEVTAAICGNREDRKRLNIKYKMGFIETEVTPSELLNYGLNGKSFCNLFHNIPSTIKENGRVINLIRKSDGAFGLNAKKDLYFFGSYCICFDIEDTRYKSAKEFIGKLTYKPTLYYSTFSNYQLREDGTNKGARFRLIYVFDRLIQEKVFFNYVFDVLNDIVEEDVNEITSDKCSRKPSQYFNGTNINNPECNIEYGITNIIYSFDDFKISKDSDYLNWIKYQLEFGKLIKSNKEIYVKEYIKNNSNKNIENRNKVQNKDNTINLKTETDTFEENTPVNDEIFIDEELLRQYDNNTPEKFKKSKLWNEYLTKTQYIFRVEKEEWIEGLFQYVDDDYFKLPYVFYFLTPKKDGNKRRKTLYQLMCLRRIIKPTATPNEIAINCIIDIIRNDNSDGTFYDNSDGVLNGDFIRRNVTNCFGYSVEELKEHLKKEVQYLKETTRPKKGIIYRNRRSHSKETTYIILDEYYNPELSVADNLDSINNLYGFKVGKTTLYEYVKNRGIITDKNRLSDEEIIRMLDFSKSAIDNYISIKNEGYKVGNKRINKLYKENKNKEELSINKNKDNKSYTINLKTENNTISSDVSVKPIIYISKTTKEEKSCNIIPFTPKIDISQFAPSLKQGVM